VAGRQIEIAKNEMAASRQPWRRGRRVFKIIVSLSSFEGEIGERVWFVVSFAGEGKEDISV